MSGTNLGRMPILIVSLVIGIVMATTAIVPLVSDYSDAKTFKNDGYYYMQKITDTSPDITLSWDYTDPLKITVGTDTVDLPTTSTYACTIIASDTWGLRWTYNASNSGLGLFGNANGLISSASQTDAYNMTISLSGGTATFTVNGVDSTQTYTEAYVISVEDADYSVMKYGDQSVYLNGDSEIYGTGRTLIAGGQKNINVSGNIDDGITATIIYPSGWTASNYVINYAAVDGYKDLYTFDSVEFDVTDGNNTATATYSQVIVPSEVISDPDNPDSYKALVKVIPVMAFVALIAAAAYMIYSKRD